MQIEFSDRSFQYGDAVFSTIRVQNQQPQLWALHWRRLSLSMQQLGFAGLAESQVLSAVMSVISAPDQVVKVLISRGAGARGYGTIGILQPQIYCWTANMPDYRLSRQHGIRLGMASLRLSRQPLLAGIKHCSRLETVLLKQEAERSEYDDLIAADEMGFVIEATASNLLVWTADGWHTPELSHAGVAGVMRQCVLEQQWVVEQPVFLDGLNEIRAMALCNALMGVVPVMSFEGKSLDISPALALQQQVDDFLQDL